MACTGRMPLNTTTICFVYILVLYSISVVLKSSCGFLKKTQPFTITKNQQMPNVGGNHLNSTFQPINRWNTFDVQ